MIIQGKTNDGLVEYAKYFLGNPYWNGTWGQIATDELYKRKKAQLPTRYTGSYESYAKDFGKQVFDCGGLIKGYLWSNSVDDIPTYHADSDCNALMFYQRSNVKGIITSFPYTNGLAVYNSSKGHIGIYSKSDNMVYQAKGRAYGVVKTEFSTAQWASWSEIPYVEYITNHSSGSDNSTLPPTIRYGNKGDTVKVWQQIISVNGGSLGSYGIDGDFGSITKLATIELQKKLFPSQTSEWDGIVGVKTWSKALSTLKVKTV